MKIIRLLCLVVVVLICFPIAGCSNKEELINGGAKAEKLIEEFFSTISKGDFLQAENYVHPHFLLIEENLADYLYIIQKREQIDFSNTITIVDTQDYTFTSDLQEFDFNGKSFSFEYIVLVGDIKKMCYITVIDNDEGYGIYRFTFTMYNDN